MIDGMDISFDIGDIDFDFKEETMPDNFIKLDKHNIQTKNVFYDNAEKLAYDINVQKNDCIYVNLQGKFIFGDFIAAFIKVNQLQVEELTVASLSGSIDNFEMFDALIEACGVKKINLILSKYFLRTEKIKHSPTIKLLEDIKKKHGENFNLYYANLHAKVVLIRTKRGFVTIHGSANLRSSTNIEQMIIQENEELYNFNYSFYKSLI